MAVLHRFYCIGHMNQTDEADTACACDPMCVEDYRKLKNRWLNVLALGEIIQGAFDSDQKVTFQTYFSIDCQNEGYGSSTNRLAQNQ